MSFWDRLLGREPSAPVPAPVRAADPGSGRGLAGGRLSLDKGSGSPLTAFGQPFVVLEPKTTNRTGTVLELDAHTLDKVSVSELLVMLADVSPDVSRALWDFLRMCNPGWTAHAYRPGTAAEDAAPDPRADAVLQAFFQRLKDRYFSWDVPLNKLFAGMFLRGALAVELVLDSDGRQALDFATPDPVSIRFRKRRRRAIGTSTCRASGRTASFGSSTDPPSPMCR